VLGAIGAIGAIGAFGREATANRGTGTRRAAGLDNGRTSGGSSSFINYNEYLAVDGSLSGINIADWHARK